MGSPRRLLSPTNVLPIAAFLVACVATPAATARPTYEVRSWRGAAPMIVPRSHLSVVTLGGSIYAIGGLLRGGAATSAVDRYDPASDKWTSLPALPFTTDHSAAAAVNASIFVFGGSFAQPSTRGFRFDIGANRWTSIAPMPEARAAGGAAVVGSRIYVVGGLDATRHLLATVYAYDPAADRWSRTEDLPTPREHLAVTTFRGLVCGMGGHLGDGRAIATSECYDPATNRWTSMPPLAKAASDFDAAVAADAIWAIGDDVQVFDGTRWWLGPQMKTPRFGLAVANADSTLFAIGGSARTPAPDGIVERLDLP
jgi:hypothetical protein